MPDYTVIDQETGQTITFQWNSPSPPTEADMAEVFTEARRQQPGGSLIGHSPARAFFGSHQPMTEGGDPLDAVGRLSSFLTERLNPALEGMARPDSLGDVAGLAIPSAGGQALRVPLTNMLRHSLIAARRAPSWRQTPQAVLERLLQWAKAPPPYAGDPVPRLAGKAPALSDVLTEAVGAARQTPPASVSLPGGGAWRAPEAPPTVGPPIGPRRRAWSSDATPPAGRSGTTADAPPAAASAGSVPPASGLSAEEAQALRDLVAEGYDEAEVLQAIARERRVARPPSAKPSLKAAEAKEYQRLTGRGVPHDEAMRLIEGQRAFQQGKGLPTSEQTRRAVVDRNTTGRWD